MTRRRVAMLVQGLEVAKNPRDFFPRSRIGIGASVSISISIGRLGSVNKFCVPS